MALQTAAPRPYKDSPEMRTDPPEIEENEHERRASTQSDEDAATALLPEGTSYPTGARFWLTVFNLCAVLVLVGLDGSIVATAVPSITDHFRTVADVGWYSSAFRLCICGFQFMFGRAYTLFPVRRVFLLSNAISILGFLLCATATSSAMLVVGRAVAGLGCSGLVAGCFTILVDTMPLHRRPFFIGVFCGAESIAILAAPPLGGVITQTLGWRWCFYITVPLGALTIALTVFCIRDNPRPATSLELSFWKKIQQMDLPSTLLLFLPALTAFFFALSRAGTKYPWDSGAVIAPLVASAVLLTGFFYNQHRLGESATLSLRIARHRSVLAGVIYISFTNAAIVILEYYLPTYYQIVRGYSPARSGTMMFPIIIAASIANLLLGWGISTTGFYAPFMLFSSIIMPIATGLITTFSINTSVAKMIVCTAFSGFANGIGFSGPQTAVQAVVAEDDVSMGLAIVLFAQSFGPAVGVAIAQAVFADQLVVNLGNLIPGFDAGSIAKQGLKGIVGTAPPGKMLEVLVGVDKSITHTWYLAVGLACATMIGSLMIEWRSVKSKR